MDPDTESLLVSTCMALGGFEDVSEDINDATQVYVMGDECLECLKDIKKFIKYFDEPGDNIALTYLGKMGILEKDLIPIMMVNTPANNPTRERLVLACIELMVPMTWVIDYARLQQMVITEEDSSIVGNLHERLEILRGYKRAFLQPGVLQAVFAVLMKPLEVEYRLRTARDQAVIRLGLSLFRNLVAIMDADTSISGTMEQFIGSIMQEELIERFEEEHIMALFVTLASSSTDSQLAEWNALTLETFFYIFEGVDPDDLVPMVSGQAKNSQLQDLLEKEEREKKLKSTAGRKRHDRFGTTGEVRLQDGTRVVMHQKGALFASFENQLDNVKRARAPIKRHKEADENKKHISKSGSIRLRNLALTLLESGFNPLFTSLRRDMESEREKIKEHHRAQYMSLVAFMLKFQRQYSEYLTKQYHEDKKNAQGPRLEELEMEYQENFLRCDFDFITTAIEVPSVYLIIRSIRDHFEPRDKKWDVIRKGINCIQEILSTLYAMSKSPKDEYRETSAIVQNNLYYEDGTLELFLELIKKYRKQSTKYLHTVVKMVHILLKTLESYSTSKTAMFIRKKIAIRKRKVLENTGKQQPSENDDLDQILGGEKPVDDGTQEMGGDEQDQDEEEDEHAPTFTMKEHKFHFQEFERRFASEHVVHTYCAFLEGFEDLDETQLHWAASLFHRIAVSCKNPAVFYKMSTLQLFHRIMQSNKEDTKKDMVPFISYLLHQFFKRMQEYPMLIAETLFPKTSRACLEINVGRDVIETEKTVITEKKEKKLMATELQVDQTLPEGDQIKIAVMALVEDDDNELVEWAIELLKEGVAKRQLMQFRSESELEENPDLMYSVENVEDIPVVANNPMKQEALRLKPRFRLLLKLLKFVKDEVDSDVQYKIPKELPTDTIADYHELLDTIYKDLDEKESYDFSALIQKINKSSSGGSGKKRSGIGGRKEVEKEIAVYHSAEYILDSDSEDDSYYTNEKKLRERVMVKFTEAEEAKRKMDEEHARVKSKKHKEMMTRMSGRKAVSLTDDEDEDGEGAQLLEDMKKPQPKTASDVEDSDEDEMEKEKRPVRARTMDERNDSESDSEEVGKNKSQAASSSSPPRSSPARQQYSSQRRVVQLDSDDSEDDDKQEDKKGGDSEVDEEATQPLSLTQRLAQTSTKRRIILDDSEDEGTMQDSGGSPPGSDDRPAKKKIAMEIDEDEDDL
ncbi:MAG: timeless protein-domain-containing protein [Benniella sp.]|nr:MAG: timeless protein-domain-containing protein [Benniella sp.]